MHGKILSYLKLSKLKLVLTGTKILPKYNEIITFWGKMIGNMTSSPCLEKEHFLAHPLIETLAYLEADFTKLFSIKI